MASLRDTVKDYQEELRNGIAWVAFWKEGRAWNSEYFYLDMDDTLSIQERGRLEEIKEKDPAAVVVNGYYSGYLGEEMSLDELTAGVRRHYENGYSNIGAFIEAHDDRLSPEEIEKGREVAHAAGLPFSEKPYRGEEDFDPYVYDGSMSIEDYELMQSMIENERSERMAEPILSGYLSNLGKYTEGRPAGEWVTFPTTAEHLKEVFDRIGIDFKNYEEWHFTEYQSVIPGLTEHLGEHEHPDELNYLGKLLSMQFDDDREKFIATIAYDDHAGSLQDIINLAQNLDCYWLYPSVHNEEEYGRYLIEELDELELPAEAKKYFMFEEYGRDASINDGGSFTEQGYIYNNRNTFTEWYDGRDVPEEYRVTPTPQQPEQTEDRDATATIPAQAVEPKPVIPIILTSQKPGEKMKEITDRLEQGIMGIFESERYADYLRTMSKFHNYSFNNTMLIAMQGGSLVKGYTQWEKEFDRHVKPGEKAIKIIAPAPYKVKKQVDKIDPDTKKPVIGKDGKTLTEEQEITIPAFKVVSVFDVSQTEGKELPDIGISELVGDVERYKDFFAALEKTSPFAIGFEQQENEGIKGRCIYEERRIAISEGMSELQNIKTAIHEIAHATMHDLDRDAAERPDRRTREVQAESVAYTVCQHYGLDTSDYSFGYVAGWSSGRELAELKSSLETIRSTAANLIETIDGHFAELQQTQEKEQTPPEVKKEQAAEQPQEVQTAAEAPAPEQTEPQETPEAENPQPIKEQETQTVSPYYTINEAAARRAKEMNSYSDYKPGSATAEYRQYVDEAVQIAERQKKRVDPMYHEKIDSLLDTYARKLADNMNKGYAIDARVPSILITGGGNFPVRKKEKQNAARDKNWGEWQEIQGLLDKIRSTGMGGISADDPQAVQKLEKKLAGLEKSQETMKAVNAYYRKHKTLDGCPHLSPEGIEKMKAEMSSSWHYEGKPYPTWALSNNNAEIRRVKERIKSLSRQKEIGYVGWEFEGGKVEANTEANRLQVFFEEKPDEAAREELKSNGFRWSPKEGAWQRQLTDNAYYAANYVTSIQPLTGEKPTDLQRAHIKQQKQNAQTAPPQEPELPAPDPTISIKEMRDYGYSWDGMLPLQQEAAEKLFSQDIEIYRIYADGTEGAITDIEDLREHAEKGGLFGVEKDAWEALHEYNAMKQELRDSEPTKEALLLYGKEDTFGIYQLARGDATRDLRFEPYDRLQATGNVVDRANYELIYTAALTPGTSLEDIYTRFNIDHPKDFKGHSLSVSDIVVLHQNGENTAHYVDSIGYKEVPEFLREQPQKALVPDDLTTGEKITTPRGSFHLTTMSVEQMKEAGYGLHHSTDDGKYLIMGNGTRAFAVAAEPPENYLKAAEQTTEQNFNMIDGQMNNTPTVAELEAKVKAGETISLVDLANAVKADKQRGSQKAEKPSIRAQLRAGKEKAQKKPPKNKSQDLERS